MKMAQNSIPLMYDPIKVLCQCYNHAHLHSDMVCHCQITGENHGGCNAKINKNINIIQCNWNKLKSEA